MYQIEASMESVNPFFYLRHPLQSVNQDDDSHPLVEDLPDDLDWDAWGGNAVCFCLEHVGVAKIYAVSPNDCSCYHLVDFIFPDVPTDVHHLKFRQVASCTMIGSKLYLIGRTDPDNLFAAHLWIWNVAERQKKDLRGESNGWKQGPRLNSPKDKLLAFSLGEYLFALDIYRGFNSPISTVPLFRKVIHSPHDFEWLKTSLNLEDPLPPWLPLPPLKVDRYGCGSFIGYCCMGDSKFMLHMVEATQQTNYFFCFDVNTMEWARHSFSGLPLSSCLSDNYEGLEKRFCRYYSAQVQNNGLFVNTLTGKISVFDFSGVFDLIKIPAVYKSLHFEYPYCDLNTDACNCLNGIEDVLGDQIVRMHTSYLGGKRYLCVVFFLHRNGSLQAWICTLDLERESMLPGRFTGYSARNDVQKFWKFGHQMMPLPK